MMRLRRLACFALLAASVALDPVAAHAAEKLTLLLDWFVNPDHGPLVVADRKGFFADQGLAVEMIAPADPNDPENQAKNRRVEIKVFSAEKQ